MNIIVKLEIFKPTDLRGKEIRITLTEDDHKEPASLNILLKFGMTGSYYF